MTYIFSHHTLKAAHALQIPHSKISTSQISMELLQLSHLSFRVIMASSGGSGGGRIIVSTNRLVMYSRPVPGQMCVIYRRVYKSASTGRGIRNDTALFERANV